MPNRPRSTFALDADAATLLAELAPGQRKKGELISQLVREHAERRDAPAMLADALTRIRGLEARVARISDLIGWKE